MAKIRLTIWEITAVKKEVANFNHYLSLIHETTHNYANKLPNFVLTIHSLAMRAFLFEVETNEH